MGSVGKTCDTSLTNIVNHQDSDSEQYSKLKEVEDKKEGR